MEEEVMFADSLLESAPHSEHRSAWTKLTSALLQSFALAVILAIPLFHVERLQIIPPLPSIRMTPLPQPPAVQAQSSARSYSTAPTIERELVQPNHIPTTIARISDKPQSPEAPFTAVPCVGNCGAGIPITNILSPGPPIIVVQPPHPARPIRVSEMKLGDLIHKVVPEYPMAAKQLRIQGTVVLMAIVGKDGRVEHVQLMSGPPLLVQPAMRAVEQWQYRPYLLNQEPVEVQTQVTVNFVLNRE
jgi:protein TonB